MTAVILAGGKSSRMGSNKAFLKLKGKTFIERQIDLLREMFDEIFIFEFFVKLIAVLSLS